MSKLDLSFKQEQRQVLSQKMIQSARILQMDHKELEEFVNELALENPLIELPNTESFQDSVSGTPSFEARIYYHRDDDREAPGEQEPWNFSAHTEDLYEYVMSQLIPAVRNSKERQVMEYLVYSLDAKGYLEIDKEEACKSLGLSEDEYETYIRLLQGTDPAGIGARNLRECLLIQLNRGRMLGGSREAVDDAHRIVLECLEEVGRNRLSRIEQKLDMPLPRIKAGIDLIRSLNPKPGNSFYTREGLRYIQPDVMVVKFSDYFEVLLNENLYSRIPVNDYYINMRHSDCPDEVKQYIEGKLSQIEWINKCIEQRNATLLKVTMAIVQVQKEFFQKGKEYLKPLRMADVADMIQMHESTVSRAVKNKYLQCSGGIYPLNYFFVKRIGAGNQAGAPEDFTLEHMKRMIREIISEEEKEHPLSDQKIAELIHDKGGDISRRTVAKYRQEMGIPGASGRKSY